MNPNVTKTIENINQQVADINKAATGKSLTPLTPITPESVSGDVPVLDIPQDTSAAKLDQTGAQLETSAEQQQQEAINVQEAKAQELKDSTSQDFGDLISELENAQSASSLIAQAEQEAGVEKFRSEVNAINNELLQEQTSLRRAIENIEKNGGGLKPGAQAEIANLKRESYAKQADLSIVQMAAQGRFDSAQRLANQKANILFDAQQQKLDIRKFVYNENKDLFTEAEQRAFDMKQSQLERQLSYERSDFESLQSAKMEALKMAQLNGAPPSVLQAIQTAESPTDVFEAGGQWGSVDMLERAYKRQQIATSRTNQLLSLAAAGDLSAISELGFDPTEKVEPLDAVTRRSKESEYEATGDLLRLATEYKALIDEKGFTNEIFGSGETLGKIDSLRAQMTAVYKDAKSLGTLDAGLLELMDQILGEKPTSSLFGIGPEGNIMTNITGKQSKKISTAMQELIDQTQIENARAAHLLQKEPWTDPLDLGMTEEQKKNSTQQTSTNPLNL